MQKQKSSDKLPITKEGRNRLLKELHFRTKVRTKRLRDHLENSWDQGDERENEYFTLAFEDFNNNLQRIREINKILKETYIQSPKQIKYIEIGHRVKLKNEKGEIVEYRIVGPIEGNILERAITSTSPIGKIILEKEIGQKVRIEIARNIKIFEIIEISY